jgi:hypothetical protein
MDQDLPPEFASRYCMEGLQQKSIPENSRLLTAALLIARQHQLTPGLQL